MADKELERRGMENRTDGAIDRIKGRVKDAAGGLTGDSGLQAEGKWDQLKGKAKDTLGEAQQELARDPDQQSDV